MKDNTKTLISELSKKYKFVDSSLLNACSCRVHNNPLFADCVTKDGRLHSDLEYALTHDTSQSAIALVQNVRDVVTRQSTFAMPAGQRHISMAQVFETLQSHDVEDASEDLNIAIERVKQPDGSIDFSSDTNSTD